MLSRTSPGPRPLLSGLRVWSAWVHYGFPGRPHQGPGYNRHSRGKNPMKLRLAVLLVLVFTCLQAQPKGREHWVATWTTAEQLARPPAAPPAAQPAAAQPPGARGFNHQTVRMIVRTSIGGRRLRVNLDR